MKEREMLRDIYLKLMPWVNETELEELVEYHLARQEAREG